MLQNARGWRNEALCFLAGHQVNISEKKRLNRNVKTLFVSQYNGYLYTGRNTVERTWPFQCELCEWHFWGRALFDFPPPPAHQKGRPCALSSSGFTHTTSQTVSGRWRGGIKSQHFWARRSPPPTHSVLLVGWQQRSYCLSAENQKKKRKQDPSRLKKAHCVRTAISFLFTSFAFFNSMSLVSVRFFCCLLLVLLLWAQGSEIGLIVGEQIIDLDRKIEPSDIVRSCL